MGNADSSAQFYQQQSLPIITTMKICAACHEELPKESFSSKQWKLKQYQRRCIRCIADNRSIVAPLYKVTENQTQQPSSADNDGKDAPSCWICLEEGDNELDQPLRRDCSCRGSDTSFVHLNCIVEYAKSKTIYWVENEYRNEDTEKLLGACR